MIWCHRGSENVKCDGLFTGDKQEFPLTKFKGVLMQKQLHLVANIDASSGGEGLAALRYAQAIASAGSSVILHAKLSGKFDCELVGGGQFGQISAPTRNNLLAELFVQYGFIKQLCEQNKIDLIHLHGMWSPFLALAALVAHQLSIPLVISPHGCLEPWALKYKSHKKWIALKTYQGLVLRSASLFVATADQELKSLRSLGIHQPVAIIPVGIDIASISRQSVKGKIKTLLFLSRVHPKKGLLDLVEAWAAVRQPGWRIVIAGGDEEGHRGKVEALIRSKGLDSDFEFKGPVAGDQKQACFDQADVFILPTYSENFGIAIAEALANEVPVITTTGAPWSELVEHRCGWWVEPGVQGISSALVDAMGCDPGKLEEMGKRGRQLVMEKYSWEKIGKVALQVSSWLIDQTLPKPEAVKVLDGNGA